MKKTTVKDLIKYLKNDGVKCPGALFIPETFEYLGSAVDVDINEDLFELIHFTKGEIIFNSERKVKDENWDWIQNDDYLTLDEDGKHLKYVKNEIKIPVHEKSYEGEVVEKITLPKGYGCLILYWNYGASLGAYWFVDKTLMKQIKKNKK